MEKMKKSYGEKVSDVFFSFLKLDEADREETKNFIEYKLSNEKYSIQEESKNA